MITIRAKLNLYKNVRKISFGNGYRPTFDLGKGLTSGRILLQKGKKEFYPGEKGEVEINFLSEELLGDKFRVGEKIVFTEGSTKVGEIEILKIISSQ